MKWDFPSIFSDVGMEVELSGKLLSRILWNESNTKTLSQTSKYLLKINFISINLCILLCQILGTEFQLCYLLSVDNKSNILNSDQKEMLLISFNWRLISGSWGEGHFNCKKLAIQWNYLDESNFLQYMRTGMDWKEFMLWRYLSLKKRVHVIYMSSYFKQRDLFSLSI